MLVGATAGSGVSWPLQTGLAAGRHCPGWMRLGIVWLQPQRHLETTGSLGYFALL